MCVSHAITPDKKGFQEGVYTRATDKQGLRSRGVSFLVQMVSLSSRNILLEVVVGFLVPSVRMSSIGDLDRSNYN